MVICSSTAIMIFVNRREVVLGTLSLGIFGVNVREMAVQGVTVVKHVNIKV